MKGAVHTPRRNVLKYGALLLAAVFGGVFAGRGNAQPGFGEQPGASTQGTLTLYGRHWHLHSQNRKRGEALAGGDQIATYGELLSGAHGTKVGEFYASGLHLRAPLGPTPFAAANVEVHTFNLLEGTIVGMGTTGAALGQENIYAVVGGTGRYTGARGSYTARQYHQERGGDGTAEFTITLTG